MSHPFIYLSSSQRKTLFWTSLLGSLVLMVVLNLVGGPLITEAAPYGIVSFEFAGNSSQAKAIIDSWDQQSRMSAAFSLGLDYLFIVTYSTAISLACLWAADVLRDNNWPLSHLGIPLALGQWLAAILDVIENLGLILILLSVTGTPWPELASLCALFKFILVFIGLVYAFYGLFVHLITRRGSGR